MTIKLNSEIIEVNFITEYFTGIEQTLLNHHGFYVIEVYNYLRDYYSNIKGNLTLFRVLTSHEFEFFKSDLNQLEMIVELFKQNLDSEIEVINE